MNESIGSSYNKQMRKICTQGDAALRDALAVSADLLNGIMSDQKRSDYKDALDVLKRATEAMRTERSLYEKQNTCLSELIDRYGYLPLREEKTKSKDMISMRDIALAVGREYDVTLEQLRSEQRKQDISWPRQEVMYLARLLTFKSTTQIGEFLNRDHTTVMHGVDAYKRRARNRISKHMEAAE